MINQTVRDCDVANPLGPYLHAITADALLTAAEERELAEAIAQGDEEARGRMIRANLRLVVKIARDYAGRGLGLDDLIGEGNLGLIRATSEFDPRFGTRFSTYAAYWIRQAIRQALTETAATIRLPAHMVGLLTRWRRVERALRRELGYDPESDRIAGELGLTPVQRDLVERALRARHLRRDSDGPEGESWLPDRVADPHGGPVAAAEADDERRDVLRRLDRLDDRERTIVSLRYGLGGGDPLTLKEVGRRLGVTREWVRKIEIRAVRKLDGTAANPARSA